MESLRPRTRVLVACRGEVARPLPCSCETTQSAASMRRSARRKSLGPRRDLDRLGQTIQRKSCRCSGRGSRSRTRLAVSSRRLASGCAAWCFDSFTQACGCATRQEAEGAPSALVGSMVQVKSMPRPITSAGSMPAFLEDGQGSRSNTSIVIGVGRAQSGCSTTPLSAALRRSRHSHSDGPNAGDLTAVGHVNQQRRPNIGAKVHANDTLDSIQLYSESS